MATCKQKATQSGGFLCMLNPKGNKSYSFQNLYFYFVPLLHFYYNNQWMPQQMYSTGLRVTGSKLGTTSTV